MSDMVTFRVEVPIGRALLEKDGDSRAVIADMAAELARREMQKQVMRWSPDAELFEPEIHECCGGGCGPVYRSKD